MNKLISIIGPTASGKSDLGIFLAKKIKGEIISIDSRQVYRGMDIGTGKVSGYLDKDHCERVKISHKKQNICPFISHEIKHWLIDIADPKTNIISAAEFQDLAYQIIFKLFSEKKTPILVGGTMLYLDAILEGYLFPKTSIKLRDELSNFTTVDLLAELKNIDPISYKKVDKHNRRRILRALESYLVNQKSHLSSAKKKPKFESLIIGIDWPRTELYKRIDQRVDIRLKQGMIEEIEHLHNEGLSYETMNNFGLEYRYISRYLQGEISRTDMIKTLKFKTHAYARRQLTWWRRNKNIIWIKSGDSLNQRAENLVKKYLAS